MKNKTVGCTVETKVKAPKLNALGDYEKKVVFDVWSNYVVHVVFTHDIAESYRKRYPKTERNFSDTHAFHAVSRNPAGNAHLFFKIGDAPAGVVAHECWHAVRELFEYNGVERLDNEVVAYHIGYLVQKVSNFLYALIDSGVKSNAARGSDESISSATQGTALGLQNVQSSDRNAGETRTSQTPRTSQS